MPLLHNVLTRARALFWRLTVRTLTFPEADFGPEPSCCPDAYWCPRAGEVECPRHGGFDVCCRRPDAHIAQPRDLWHRQMGDYEQALLNAHIRQHTAARFPIAA